MISIVLTALSLISFESKACLYFDRDYDRSLFKETEREALFFRDREGAVNLILKTGLQGKLPKKIAFVFPLPSVPISYKTTDPAVFADLRALLQRNQLRGSAEGLGRGKGIAVPSNAIQVLPTQQVDGYEIVPIKILRTDSAGDELNAWLGKQKFNTLPLAAQKPYLKPGAVFLAIRWSPKGADQELRPLWVRYRSDEMRFPLRFTHDDRTFDLRLYRLGGEAEFKGSPSVATEDHVLELVKDAIAWERYPRLAKFKDSAKENTRLQAILIPGVNKSFQTARLTEDPGWSF